MVGVINMTEEQLPCKVCIVLAVCKAKYNQYLSTYDDSLRSMVDYETINKCEMITKFVYPYGRFTPTDTISKRTRRWHSFFKGSLIITEI